MIRTPKSGSRRSGIEELPMKQTFIAVAAAAVYLIISLLTDGWAWTWIIWIFYGIYRITDMVKKSNDE